MKKKKRKNENANSAKISRVFGFTRKMLDDFQGLPLLLSKNSTKSLRTSMVCFRNDFLWKSTTLFGSHSFSEEKRQYSLDVKRKHTFTKQILAKVSPSNNNYCFIKINHSTTTTRTTRLAEPRREAHRSLGHCRTAAETAETAFVVAPRTAVHRCGSGKSDAPFLPAGAHRERRSTEPDDSHQSPG